MTLSINDRVSYQGEKATVKQVWKKKVRVILSDLREMTVGIDEVRPADEAIPGQLPLIDLSQYQHPDRPISQWDLENEDSIETLTPDGGENEDSIETLTPDSDQSVDAIEIDVRSVPTYQLITLYEVIARELHYRDESECSLPNPNPLPNPLPNSLPNCLPNYGYEEIKTIKGRQYRYWRWLENDKLRSKYLGRCENVKKSC
ncbi:hypothetical protein PN472_06775 [Microcystis aeruginosa CS-1036]|nr:hypothetical protein [Microcystis aeruginosa CS-1036]